MFFKKIIFILVLIVLLAYITNITSIPNNIVLFEGENLNLGTIFGIFQNKQKVISTSFNTNGSNVISEETVHLSFLNIINIKDVNVTTIENTKVIPLGNTIGLKLYSNGVLVIGMTEIEGKKPYENTGIKEGDLIISVDNTRINNTQELIECVKASKGKTMELTLVRDGEEQITTIAPAKNNNNEYKLRTLGKRWGSRDWNYYLL